MASIGKSIRIKGTLSGDEDIQIEGTFEGRVKLGKHQLSIAQTGRVSAELQARAVVVMGQVTGNIQARDSVEIRETGVVEGDIKAPRLVIHEGAVINGDIQMTGAEGTAAQTADPARAPVAAAAVGRTG